MDIKAAVTIPSANGIAGDSVTNQFVFTDVTPSGVGDHWVAIKNALVNFYNTTPTGGLGPIADLLSAGLDNNANRCSIDMWDLAGHLSGTPLGSPDFGGFWTLDAPAGFEEAMPSEVAFCVTLEGQGRDTALVETDDGGDAGSAPDRPRERLTGRFYLGPLNDKAKTVTASGICIPAATIVDTSRLAVKQLMQDVNDDTDGFLGVWSRKNAAVVPAVAVSCDNAFDTQRRRGEKATLRSRTVIAV